MIRFPWTVRTAPNFLLEITSACNVLCRGCYKIKATGVRTLEEIQQDLETGLQLRRVQTVSIAGAEPTLHPQLAEIVALIRQRGLRAALLTNGLLLTDRLLADLKAAGLDVAMVHIDEGQRRPDLPASPTLSAVNALRLEITSRVASHGIDAGLSVTIYPDTLANISSLVRLMIEAEHIGFLFASHYVDVHALAAGGSYQPQRRTENAQIVDLLARSFGVEPFAEADPHRPLHWMSYFVPVIYPRNGHPPRVVQLKSGWLDSFLVSLPRLLSGRNLFYTRQSSGVTLGHILLNSLFRGDARTSSNVLLAACRGRGIGVKRMIFDNGVSLTPEGKLDCLDFCPNSTVRNGTLVPICLSDYANQLKPADQ